MFLRPSLKSAWNYFGQFESVCCKPIEELAERSTASALANLAWAG